MDPDLAICKSSVICTMHIQGRLLLATLQHALMVLIKYWISTNFTEAVKCNHEKLIRCTEYDYNS